LWSGGWTGWDEARPILARLIAKLEQRKIHLESQTEKVETSSPAGRLVFHVFAALAEWLLSSTTKAWKTLRLYEMSSIPAGEHALA
jgi:hypothetical protein